MSTTTTTVSISETSFHKLPTGPKVKKSDVPIAEIPIAKVVVPVWGRCPDLVSIPPFPSTVVEAIRCDSKDAIVTLFAKAEAKDDEDEESSDEAKGGDEDSGNEDSGDEASGDEEADDPTFTKVPLYVPKVNKALSLSELAASFDESFRSVEDQKAMEKLEIAEVVEKLTRGIVAANALVKGLRMGPHHCASRMPQYVYEYTPEQDQTFKSTERTVSPFFDSGRMRVSVAEDLAKLLGAKEKGFSVFVGMCNKTPGTVRVCFRKLANDSTPKVAPPPRADRAPAPAVVRAYGGAAAERARAQGEK
jgi:hypothetical protein